MCLDICAPLPSQQMPPESKLSELTCRHAETNENMKLMRLRILDVVFFIFRFWILILQASTGFELHACVLWKQNGWLVLQFFALA